jgi:glycosyltransferase involved in cell wall biosynthesis
MPTPRRPVRVLQVALSLDPGGTERLVLDIARGLASHGLEPAVCCLDSPGAWAADLERDGIPVESLARRPGFRPGVSVGIARIARERRIDVLHCHQYTPYVYGCLAKLLRPSLRLVFTEHGRLSDAPPSAKRRLVNPWLARVPGARFAVCEELKRYLVAEGFPENRLGVIYNGIDLGSAPGPDDRRAARERLGLDDTRLVVGTVARLDPVKDHATLLDAFARIRGHVPDAALVLIGDGPERTALEARAAAAGIADAVSFLGTRSDVRRLLPGLDLFVNSSRTEGVSLTIVEAMAAGLPVVATRVGGTPEVVADGRTGLLVPPADPETMAAAAAALAADPERARRLGVAARALAEERFAFDRMLDRYVSAYTGTAPHS